MCILYVYTYCGMINSTSVSSLCYKTLMYKGVNVIKTNMYVIICTRTVHPINTS
jgi:hypothetical protein